jgi:hypothetical protein
VAGENTRLGILVGLHNHHEPHCLVPFRFKVSSR